MNDPVVGMETSKMVGASAVTTATGLIGAQVVASLQNQGVQASMEQGSAFNTSFHRSAAPEQVVQKTAPTIERTLTPTIAR